MPVIDNTLELHKMAAAMLAMISQAVGAASIESSPDESLKIAALPGARVEICSTKTLDELMQYDLLQMVNLKKLWESAWSRNAASSPKEIDAADSSVPIVSEQKMNELVDDISEVASAYLSKQGRAIVVKRIKELGGPSQLLNDEKRLLFLAQTEADAKAADSNARIEEMIDLIKSEIAGRLSV